MTDQFDSSVTNPATWGAGPSRSVPGHEWIESVSKLVLILAILLPLLTISATRPRRLAHVSTYALLVGGLGSVLFMIALGVRASSYKEMPRARRVVYVA